MKISKELFCSSIEALRQQNHKDRTFASLMDEAFGAEIGLLYNNEILINFIIDVVLKDFDREDLIHYCYFLNFGKLSSEEDFESTEQFYERLVNSK